MLDQPNAEAYSKEKMRNDSPAFNDSLEGTARLIYAACPSRLAGLTDEIFSFVADTGNACLHPFAAMPFQFFEGSPTVGRERTLDWCCRLINASDEFWIFGISAGTLLELEYAMGCKMRIRNVARRFDPQFELEKARFARRHRAAFELLATV